MSTTVHSPENLQTRAGSPMDRSQAVTQHQDLLPHHDSGDVNLGREMLSPSKPLDTTAGQNKMTLRGELLSQ